MLWYRSEPRPNLDGSTSEIVQAVPSGTHGCSAFGGETARYIGQFGTKVDVVSQHKPPDCLKI